MVSHVTANSKKVESMLVCNCHFDYCQDCGYPDTHATSHLTKVSGTLDN